MSKFTPAMIGQKYNKWTIESFSDKKRKQTYVKAKCDCGTVSNVRLTSIINNHSKSCHKCSIKRNQEHHSWRGVGELSLGFFSRYKYTESAKEYGFSITIEYAWKLFLQQNRKCALTGWDINFGELYQDGTQTASLDRVYSDRGYVEGNVQWVHRDVNTLKSDWNEQYFIHICHAISSCHKDNYDVGTDKRKTTSTTFSYRPKNN